MKMGVTAFHTHADFTKYSLKVHERHHTPQCITHRDTSFSKQSGQKKATTNSTQPFTKTHNCCRTKKKQLKKYQESTILRSTVGERSKPVRLHRQYGSKAAYPLLTPPPRPSCLLRTRIAPTALQKSKLAQGTKPTPLRKGLRRQIRNKSRPPP